MKKIFYSLLTCSFFIAISCSGVVDNSSKIEKKPFIDTTVTEKEAGITTKVSMFIPDYYALAEQGGSRAIAPQTVSARLLYNVSNIGWIGIDTVDLSTATKTPVENAPEGFTGFVYTLSFNGLPVGSYGTGNLKIELLDNSEKVITSGLNAVAITATKEHVDDIIFYTVPESTGTNSGNLSAGEMKFSRAPLVKGITYNIVLTSSGDYPDLVLFGSDGKLSKYYAVDSAESATVNLTVDSTDVYYLGLWADDGKDIARYTMSFDFGDGTELSGVLTGSNLHWTKENSPYFVNANILVEEGTELTIDPGVIVQFTGNYYLKVTGTISAVGTKIEPIIFVQSGDNLNNWAGISVDSTTSLNVTNTYTYASGNIFKNCMVIGATIPLTLNSATYVDSCTFTGNSSYVNVNSNSLLINNLLENGIYVGEWNSPRIINNIIKNTFNSCYSYAYVENNTLSNGSIIFDCARDGFTFKSNNVQSCEITAYGFESNVKIIGNNLLGYNGNILDVSNCSYADRKSFNFTGNYWGEAQTAEIESKCGSGVADSDKDYNMSFFTDYYDNFENTKIDFSNWATEQIEGAGYLGDGFIAFDYTINGYNYENGGYYPESKDTALAIVINPKYHANDIASIRIAQSLASLKEKEWSNYSVNQSFTVNKNALIDGLATIYVQLKDSEGNVSSPVMHEVPFDNPVVSLSIVNGATYSNATSSVNLTYSAIDKGNITQYSLFIDGVKVSTEEYSYGWGKSLSCSYTLGLTYMSSGTHKVKATFWDSVRNETSKEITFAINRNVDTSGYAGILFDATTGQLLKDSNTIYLWHLDSDGSEVSDSAATIEEYSAGEGCLCGYANSVGSYETIDLNVDNAFTVEFWRKGRENLCIYKNTVFDIREGSFWWNKKSNSGSISSDSFDIPWGNDNEWHFWSFVANGNYAAIYCDGKLINYKVSSTLNTNNNKIRISANNIDELRISSVARSADEIAAYYAVAKDKIQ